jgi:outer membrane immunogenic protein
MRKTFLASIAGVALVATGSANAADIVPRAYKAPPLVVPVPVTPWTGFYFGINGGYGWARDRINFEGLGPIFQPTELASLFTAQDGVTFLSSAFAGPGAGPIGTIHDRGWLVGAHAGYNWQLGAWVAGLEADIDAAGIKGSASASGTNLETVTLARISAGVIRSDPVPADVTRSVNFRSKIDELASLRARLGFLPIPELLLYGTGGAAWAHTTDSISLSQKTTPHDFLVLCLAGSFCNIPTSESFNASTGSTHLGWSAGVGGEWKFAPNWNIGMEYLHYEFPRNTLSFGDGNVSFTLPGDHRLSVDTVRARLSWQL